VRFIFFSSRRRHTRFSRDWSSDVCSSDLLMGMGMAWNNSLAVAEGFLPGSSMEFLRTPKFRGNLPPIGYTLPTDRSLLAEIALADRKSVVEGRSAISERV